MRTPRLPSAVLLGMALASLLPACQTAALPAPRGLGSAQLWTPGAALVLLSWAPVEEAVGYVVDRQTGSGPLERLTATPVREPRYQDRAVTGGTTYTYTVSAVRLDGALSLPSAPLTVTIPASVPRAPPLGGEGRGVPLRPMP